MAVERANRLLGRSDTAWVTRQLEKSEAPVVAVSDYVRAVAESIRAFVPAPYVALGTDGFGRSDTRAHLRDFFEVDARWIAFAAISELPEFRERRVEIAGRLGLGPDQGS
jgi:pyruvate dehydrogenase E1 component